MTPELRKCAEGVLKAMDKASTDEDRKRIEKLGEEVVSLAVPLAFRKAVTSPLRFKSKGLR